MKHPYRYDDYAVQPVSKPGWGRLMIVVAIIGILVAMYLLSGCAVVESVARTGKHVLGVTDSEPPRNAMRAAMPENEWEATWKGERDKTLRELRFGKEGQ